MEEKKEIKIGLFYTISILIVLLWGIDLEYIQRQGILPKGFSNISKILSYGLILAIPISLIKILKILKSSKIIWFFTIWVFFSTIISYFITQFLGYEPRFSNEVRTITQLGGFSIGIILGYYLSNLLEKNPKFLKFIIHISIFIVILGIFYQLISQQILGSSGKRYEGRLFGLSGEPKFLALYLAPYLIALIISTKRFSFIKFVYIFLLFFALIFTKSSTAFIALFFIISICLKVYGLKKLKIIKIISTLLFFMVFIYLLPDFFGLKDVIFGRISNYAQGIYDSDLHEVFTFPLIGTVTVEANEYPVLLYFKDNPYFIFTGIGLGQESILSFGIIDSLKGGSGFLRPGRVGYITPNSSLLQNTANFGLLFVILLFFWTINLASKYHKDLDENKKFIFYFFFSHFIIHLIIFKTYVPISTSLFILLSFFNLLKKTRKTNYKIYNKF